jgi:hypothetical protein
MSEPEARAVRWTEERAQRGTSEHATREAHGFPARRRRAEEA